MSQAIKYLSHHQIDKKRWDFAIDSASNGMMYAKSFYLDAMSPSWDALIYGDYKALMPITWRSKWGIRYMCQPAFAQQLGVFYIDENFRNRVPDFLEIICKKFWLIEIFINYDNQLHTDTATNYLLPLAGGYPTVHSNFSPSYIQSLKRAARFKMHYLQEPGPSSILDLYQSTYSERIPNRLVDYKLFGSVVEKLVNSGNALVRSARLTNGELLAASIILKDHKRLYNVVNVITSKGRETEANYFLYDRMLEELSSTGLIFDFEGSDIPGVAKFYKKFNPVTESYFFFKSNRLPWIMKMLKG